MFRCKDRESFYRLVLRPQTKDLRVEKVIQGKSDYASTPHVAFSFTSNCWYHVRLAAPAAALPPGPPTPPRQTAPLVQAAPSIASAVKLQETAGMFRAVRVRRARDRRVSPLLAQPSLPLLAVARATTGTGQVVAALRLRGKRKWLPHRENPFGR